jgi:hypothetical protein
VVEADSTAVLKKVLNLVHLAQYYKDQKNREIYVKDAATDKSVSLQDFATIHEFYNKVFLYPESAKFELIGNKMENSLSELTNYLQQSESPALMNKSYKHLAAAVENVSNSEIFRNKSADLTSIVKQDLTGVIGNINKSVEQPKKEVLE